MIVGIRHKGLRRFYEDGDRSKLPADMVDRIARILLALETAESIDALAAIHTLRLHALHGDLAGFWSVTVRANWRIIFRTEGHDITDVDFLDYH